MKKPFCLTFLFLVGCNEIAPENEHKYATIVTQSSINKKMALTIDFIQIYDKNLYQKLQMMTAREFFIEKRKILLDHPDGLSVWSVDFIEHQQMSYEFPFNRNYWGVIIFVHFTDGSSGKIIVPENQRKSLITISDGEFSIAKDRKHQRKYKNLHPGESAILSKDEK